MDDMREFMMATTEFAPATHYTDGEQREEISVKYCISEAIN